MKYLPNPHDEKIVRTILQKMDTDPVNHPKHYTDHPSGIECIDVTEHMTFCLGNAVKYIWRAGKKDSTTTVQDLEKAKWYISREINRLIGENPKNKA